jgi:NAD(P)-dependent dehydrogenase (short-subunit alcohol dehydrogenase family)
MNDPLFDLNDKVVVVTGGLGQLGRRYSAAILQRGGRVACLDISDKNAGLDDNLGQAHKDGRLLLLKGDVTSRESLLQCLEKIEDAWETPNGLINNAGLDSPPNASPAENGPFETYPVSSWDNVMAVNVKGVFLACQVFGDAMARAQRGSIINVGSTYGIVSPDQRLYQYRRDRGEAFFKPVAYSASKSALYNLSRYLATYWGACGVRVNTITLGGVFNNQDKEFTDAYTARVPLGRMADEGDYDGAIVFLLSDASSYMTGANLVVDGGWTAW